MSRDIEIFKDIQGYEGLYQVSNLGRIKSLERDAKHHLGGTRRVKERIMKFDINKKFGYLRVHLHKDGADKKYLAHRLVAIAFIPNPNNYEMVNHIDESPRNNCIKNLEWCNVQYNNTYGTKLQKIYKKKIIQLDSNNNFLKGFESIKEAANETGIHISCITNCIRKAQKTAGGYIWKPREEII